MIVLSSLTERNRQKLVDAGAEDYIEKSSLSPVDGVNPLPNILENIICRIHRKRGNTFPSVPQHK